MIFYKEQKNEMKCLKCHKSRFIEVINEEGEKVMTEVVHKQLRYMPLTLRMKRLFLSKKTARHMTWYTEGVRVNDQVMVHMYDDEAWKALDNFDADFVRDVRNVCFGLVIDGFTPYNSSMTSYSC
jgi:hypothetical protein